MIGRQFPASMVVDGRREESMFLEREQNTASLNK